MNEPKDTRSAAGPAFLKEGRELRRLRPMRWKLRASLRSTTIRCLYPFARLRAAMSPADNSLRVVLYHHVFDDERENFRRHLAWMAGRFEIVDVERFLSLAAGPERLQRSALLVTFDDGFKDNITNALPILDELGVKAVFFVSTGFIALDGTDAEGYRRFAAEVFHAPRPVENMRWSDLAELRRRGHSVGSHTITHRKLSELPVEEVVRELEESRRLLEEKLGRKVEDLSFPYGRADDARADLKELARRAGYRSCFNMIRGANAPGTDPYFINRDALDAGWPLVQVKYFMQKS